MVRWIRRLFVLLLIGAGIAYALRTLTQRRSSATDATLAPQWPPLVAADDGSDPALQAEIIGLVEFVEVDAADADAPASSTEWVAPVDGGCPDGYPIKANDNSHIFHVPGGRFYDRTVPERCYATANAAERDGYRRAKA